MIISDALYPPTLPDAASSDHTDGESNEASISLGAFRTIVRIAAQPRVFGIHLDSASSVRVRKLRKLLIDGGANICITGDLTSLVGVVDIPPMPITVALAESAVTTDNCCTKRGFIPLVCTDGSVYWQICFYCANVVETIISPQAVLASSDVFHTWTQTGYKDGRTGSIRFDRADNFLSMHLPLDYYDGLY